MEDGDPGYTGTVTFPTVDSQFVFPWKEYLVKKKKKWEEHALQSTDFSITDNLFCSSLM